MRIESKNFPGVIEPMLALIIPVFNDFSGLVASLNSIYISVPHVVFIVDDGSDVPVSKFRLQRLIPPCLNVEVISQSENTGIVAALNRGLRAVLDISSIKYIARLDAGDICHPLRFAEQMHLMDNDAKLGIVGTWACFIDAVSGSRSHVWEPPLDDGNIRKKMHQNVCFIHPSWMVRRGAIESVGLYSDIYLAAEDYDLSMRILQRFHGCNIPNYYVTCTTNDAGISHSMRKIQLFSRARIQLRYFDFGLMDSYVGIFKTAILLLLPYKTYRFLRSSMSPL